MMMTLGLYIFKLSTLPYQSVNRTVNYNWAQNNRVGLRPASQFLGVEKESMVLTGQLMTDVTGGQSSLTALQLMADSGRAWPLIEGTGIIYGMFIIETINNVSSQLLSNGRARDITFTITLKRVDESYTAMFGDLSDQGIGLFNKAVSAFKASSAGGFIP